ncbi:MAG: hypothetical protein KGO02_20965 [Alphaproteobacteria bacterium]|nr:hypothetical protein [Alphaproteobacteria bacterium]
MTSKHSEEAAQRHVALSTIIQHPRTRATFERAEREQGEALLVPASPIMPRNSAQPTSILNGKK